MEKPVAPADYEELIRVIHERYDSMSKGYQTIALYLTQNPNDVAVRSVNAIAERCGMHASNFVRFAQALGYTGFKDLQELFQKRLSTAAPGFEARVKALEGELGAREDQQRVRLPSRSRGARRRLAAGAARLTSLPTTWRRAADLLEKADVVYLIGQLRSAPVVELLRYVLTMLGKRCVLLDPSGGLATHMARTMRTGRRPGGRVVPLLRDRGRQRRRGGGRARRRRSSPSPTARCRRSPRARRCSSPCRSTSTPSRARSPPRCASPRR